MDIQLLLVPYDSGQRGWRCGAGPEHLVRAGLAAHLQCQGHIVTAIHIIEDDAAYPSAEIRTAFELARRLATAVRSARSAANTTFAPAECFLNMRWCPNKQPKSASER